MAKGDSKSYNPAATEKTVWDFWIQGGFFHPEPDDRPKDKRFCIMIPLPNVTAALHLGHALNNTLQDILTRFKRMTGCNTLWMMGTDHAGIATQATVEKTIFEKEGKNRHDLGPDELVRRIWEWKDKFGGRIIEQLKQMGCSGDYERERFTLDKGCAKAVRETFFKLFRDGLIYRGKRLVNWDTQLKTAVADDEVYHETKKGHFWHFKYPVNNPQPGEPEFVHIATTRPETMLGDTAVAVHPEPDVEFDRMEEELKTKLAEASEKERPEIEADLEKLAERRKTHLPTLLKLRDMANAGRTLTLPLVNREIPLICDIWAKPDLGSGCVKITPAHDPNDYDVGKRHDLAQVNVMTEDGKIARIIEPDGSVNANSEKYEGLKFATKGREKVVADLEAQGLVEQIEDRAIEIGHSDRSKTPIEPFLSDQWFVRMGDLEPEHAAKVKGLRHNAPGLAQMAMDAVSRGEVHFHPHRYEKTYMDWLSEKRDWCISRQLWWGHRIPVWTACFSGKMSGLGTRQAIKDRRNTILAELRQALDELASVSGCDPADYLIAPHHQGSSAVASICVRTESANRQLAAVASGMGRAQHVSGSEPYKPVVDEIMPQDPRTAPSTKIRDILDGHGLRKEDKGLEQDPDVLDTWFSSALWPHSTLGWPDADHADPKSLLGHFYPTSVLITAREIITLWVARMVMTGLYNIGDIPFTDVIIHSVIQDGQGRKMSKTLGNGVDPQDIIEEYGADALRFTLADQATETQDTRLPVTPKKLPDGRTINISDRFEKGRNFCNKLWQASTGFVMANIDGYDPKPLDPASLSLEDRWILSRMTACAEDLNSAMQRFRFSEAMKVLYRFMWDEYCSWYIEMTKPRLAGPDRAAAQQVLVYVLDQVLRMLHPFIPFITEGIWHRLNEVAPRRGLTEILEGEHALVTAAWPQVNTGLRNETVEADMATLESIIKGVREIRTEVNDYRGRTKQPSMRTLPLATIRSDAATCKLVETYQAFILPLAQCDTLEAGENVSKPKGAMSRVAGNLEIYVPVADLIDLSEVRKTEEAKLADLRSAKERAEKQLANENFVKRANPEVVAQARQRAADLSNQISIIEQHLADLV